MSAIQSPDMKDESDVGGFDIDRYNTQRQQNLSMSSLVLGKIL